MGREPVYEEMFFFRKHKKTTDDSPASPSSAGTLHNTTPSRSFSDHDRYILYSQGRVVNLPAGGRLKLTKAQEGYFLLTAGSANLILDTKLDIVRIGKGDWLTPASLLPDDGSYVLHLKAEEDSKLLYLARTAIAGLDAGTRRTIDEAIGQISTHLNDCLTPVKPIPEPQSLEEQVRQFIRARTQSRLSEYERSRFVQRAIAGIETLPTVPDKFLKVMSSDSTPLTEVTSYITANPSLSTEVLKVVNSAYYGLKTKVSDIHRAVLYLGLNQIYQIVISNSLLKVIGNSPFLLDIHNHSMIISQLAGLLCTNVEKTNLAAATTIGILHDVGEIVKFTMREKHQDLDILIDHLSSPKLGSMLLLKWGIPETVFKTIEMQDHSSISLADELPEEFRSHLAYLRVAHDVYSFFSSDDYQPDPLTPGYLSVLGFEDTSLEELIRFRIIPALRNRSHKLPVNVQVFFSV